MQALYIFAYYLVYHLSILAIADGEIQYKKKRKLICLSSILLILTIPVIIFIVFNVFQTGAEATPVWFMLFHILCIIPIILCCENNPFVNWIVIMIISNIWYIISSIFFNYLFIGINPDIKILKSSTSPDDFIYLFAYILCSFLAVVFARLFFFFFKKSIEKRWAFISISILFTIPMLIAIVSAGFENHHRINTSPTSIYLTIVCYPVAFFISFAMYLIQHYRKTHNNAEELEMELDKCLQEYDKLINLLEESRHFRHDLNNDIAILEEYSRLSNDNQIQELTKCTKSIIEKSRKINLKKYCNNSVINILLTIKADAAQAKGINCSFTVILPDKLSIENYDLVSLLSNILDNAIEATEKVEEDKRQIAFRIHTQNGYLCVECINPFVEEANPVKKDFATTKSDKSNHGMGTKIISNIIKSYNGYSDITILNGDHFNLFIALKL